MYVDKGRNGITRSVILGTNYELINTTYMLAVRVVWTILLAGVFFEEGFPLTSFLGDGEGEDRFLLMLAFVGDGLLTKYNMIILCFYWGYISLLY